MLALLLFLSTVAKALGVCEGNTCDTCDHIGTTVSSHNATCPNCDGLNYDCLAKQEQQALGADGTNAAAIDFRRASATNRFCKMQVNTATNRTETRGPKLLADGRVFAGVAISPGQFYSDPLNKAGDVACGMCVEITADVPKWNCALNQMDKSNITSQTFVAMVDDVAECSDPPPWTSWDSTGHTALSRCATGHLDLQVFFPDPTTIDIYQSPKATWKRVDCPMLALPINYVINYDQWTSYEFDPYFFNLMLWDTAVPVKQVEVCG